MASIDIYLNETTRHADVILPTTTALERDQYDLVFHGLAVRNTARFTPAVFPKEPGTRHEWEIFRDLASRITARLDRKPPLAQRLRQRARLAVSPTLQIRALLATRPEAVLAAGCAGIPRASTSARCARPCPSGCRRRTSGSTSLPRCSWPTSTGCGPRSPRSRTPPAGDLLLIGRRHKQDSNSWMHNTERLTRGRARHQLLMHPDDLAARGIADGSRVTVRSRVGEVVVEVAAADDMMPGVVSLPHGYGHQVDGTRMRTRPRSPGCRSTTSPTPNASTCPATPH